MAERFGKDGTDYDKRYFAFKGDYICFQALFRTNGV